MLVTAPGFLVKSAHVPWYLIEVSSKATSQSDRWKWEPERDSQSISLTLLQVYD